MSRKSCVYRSKFQTENISMELTSELIFIQLKRAIACLTDQSDSLQQLKCLNNLLDDS